jgi:P27 family predicted phage terminase small subunit
MGKRGPAKEPAELKKAKGTFRASRDGEPPPVDYDVPSCPFAEGSPEALSWDRLMGDMKAAGLDAILTRADQGTLEAAAIAWCRARQASADFAALPLPKRYVQTRSNGLRPHPARDVERTAWSDYRRFAADLGLSPSARASLSTPDGGGSGGGPDNDLDKLTQAMLAAGPTPVYDDDDE